MYLMQTAGMTAAQYWWISSFSCPRFLGLTLSQIRVFIEPHNISIGFKSGDSAKLSTTVLYLQQKMLNILSCMFRIVVDTDDGHVGTSPSEMAQERLIGCWSTWSLS